MKTIMTGFHILDDYVFFPRPSANSDALPVAFGSAFNLGLMGYPQAHNLSEVNNPCHSLELLLHI